MTSELANETVRYGNIPIVFELIKELSTKMIEPGLMAIPLPELIEAVELRETRKLLAATAIPYSPPVT